MQAQLTIQIVTWNSRTALSKTIRRLRKVPVDVVIRVIDNGSSDGTVALMRQALPRADIIERKRNTGFAGGHNFGFALCATPFVLVLNPDVELNWNGIMQLLEAFADEKVAGVQGKLYQELGKGEPVNQIFDTAGIVQTLSLNGRDRGANDEDRGQFDTPAEIFGIQGACALYRLQSLLEVAHTRIDGEAPDVFDEDFFAYKDDVDVGWRLRASGWKVLYQPVVAGWHARGLGRSGIGGWGLQPAGIYRRLRDVRTRLSFRNYCWMLVKNASVGQFVLHSPWIAGRFFIFFLFSAAYPPLFSVWFEIWRGLPNMLAKRL